MRITKEEEKVIKALRGIRELFRKKKVYGGYDAITDDPDWWNDTILGNVVYYVMDKKVE